MLSQRTSRRHPIFADQSGAAPGVPKRPIVPKSLLEAPVAAPPAPIASCSANALSIVPVSVTAVSVTPVSVTAVSVVTVTLSVTDRV